MKSMNVSDDIVKHVQQKIETEARDKVQSVMGHAGYETYDWLKLSGKKINSLQKGVTSYQVAPFFYVQSEQKVHFTDLS